MDKIQQNTFEFRTGVHEPLAKILSSFQRSALQYSGYKTHNRNLVYYRVETQSSVSRITGRRKYNRIQIHQKIRIFVLLSKNGSFRALTVLVGRQEEHPACKNR